MFLGLSEGLAHYEQVKGRNRNVISLNKTYKVICDAPRRQTICGVNFLKK